MVAVALAMPILPAVVYGEFFAGLADAWRDTPPPAPMLAMGVAGILASDILLPVPSGPLSTLAGAQLGFWAATAACWAGMTAGASLAFAACRLGGGRLAKRLADPEQLDELRPFSSETASAFLLATRPLPVLAEAAVLVAGLTGVAWRRFLPPIVIGNLLVAAAYAWVGQSAAAGEWLIPALVASVIVPLLLVAGLRKLFGKPRAGGVEPADEE